MNFYVDESAKFENIYEPSKAQVVKKRSKRKQNDMTSFPNFNAHQLPFVSECYERQEPTCENTSYLNSEYNLDSIDYMCEGQSLNSNNKSCEKPKLISINEAFEILRTHIPTFPYERRLSKIDTLHLAISYIYLLQSVIESNLSFYDYLQTSINSSIVNRAQMSFYNKPKWETSGKYLRKIIL